MLEPSILLSYPVIFYTYSHQLVDKKEGGVIDGVKIDIVQIPKVEICVFCAVVLDAVLRFYEDPKNAAGFERWLAEREGGEYANSYHRRSKELTQENPSCMPESRCGLRKYH